MAVKERSKENILLLQNAIQDHTNNGEEKSLNSLSTAGFEPGTLRPETCVLSIKNTDHAYLPLSNSAQAVLYVAYTPQNV